MILLIIVWYFKRSWPLEWWTSVQFTPQLVGWEPMRWLDFQLCLKVNFVQTYTILATRKPIKYYPIDARLGDQNQFGHFSITPGIKVTSKKQYSSSGVGSLQLKEA